MRDDAWEWDDDDEDNEEDREPEADPSCVECGGQGGWCASFTPEGLCVWVDCDCVS